MSPKAVMERGKERRKQEARVMFFYWAKDILGIRQRELAKRSKLTQPTVSQVVRRGERSGKVAIIFLVSRLNIIILCPLYLMFHNRVSSCCSFSFLQLFKPILVTLRNRQAAYALSVRHHKTYKEDRMKSENLSIIVALIEISNRTLE